MPLNHPHQTGPLSLCLVAALIVWSLQLIGVFSPLDGLAYDACLYHTPAPSRPPAVLLLEWRPNSNPRSYSQAVRDLTGLGARRVAFTFVPEDAPPDFFPEAARLDVVFGRPFDASAAGPITGEPAHAFTGVASPPLAGGVARRHRAWVDLKATRQPLLEAELADRLGAGVRTADYGIHFRGGPGSLPRATSDDLLTGRLIPELVRGRVVLVGRAVPPEAPGLWTPTSVAEPFSLLEFQGQALDSLLRGRNIRPMSPLLTLPTFLTLATLTAVLFLRLGMRHAVWAWPLPLVAVFAGGYLSVTCLDSWPPVAALATGQVVCWLLILADRASRSSHVLRRTMTELAVRDRQQPVPLTVQESKEHWDRLAAFTAEALGATRQLVLEVIPGTTRVQEIAAQGCSLEDIRERRRDMTRAPYVDATAARGPILLQDRPFFTAIDPGEALYLVPLTAAERPLGFWVVGVPASLAGEGMRVALVSYAGQITAMLSRRQESMEMERKLSGQDADHADPRSLAAAVTLFEGRLRRAERILGATSHPKLVCDPFGRVHEVNALMRRHLAGIGADPQAQCAAEILAALTGKPIEETYPLLRAVVQDRRPRTLPLQDSKDGRRFSLHLHPLTEATAAGESTPAGPTDIVFEMVDRTAEARLDGVREGLVEQLGVAVRNELAALELAAGLLASGDCDPDERVQLGGVIADKARHIATLHAQAQASFDDPLGDGARMPVDPTIAFREAIAPPTASGRPPADVRLSQPLVLPFVLAAPGPLRQTFAALLEFLSRDARPGTPIRVAVDQTPRYVRYSFATDGFGLPRESLQQLLTPGDRARAEELHPLHDGLRRVRAWGGVVEADSMVGEGMTVALYLPSFTWEPGP